MLFDELLVDKSLLLQNDQKLGPESEHANARSPSILRQLSNQAPPGVQTMGNMLWAGTSSQRVYKSHSAGLPTDSTDY